MNAPAPLLPRLPAVRGEIKADVPLKDTTWFKVGGAAEVLFQPADADDLAQFFRRLPAEIPATILGLGSNVIVRDGGIEGVVVRLGPLFRSIKVEEEIITVGAATVDSQVARQAMTNGLAGLEFLSGIPGSIGGGLRMNAGAYGSEFKDVVIDALVVERLGKVRTITNAELGFAYRHCGVPDDWVFLSARLKGKIGDKAEITAKMQEISKARTATQPVNTYTGGSTFANPDGKKAWELIEAAGCRGLKQGAAEVSEQHCNFLINTGKATAADLETLGETVRSKVKEKAGVDLQWEIRRYGKPA
ncbi:MAG: UDP-N-acetylmuramate dehydrogenase [Proteobacteria bacterium]|nr:UDP-N-acetylmuramate dehydrogenase [Pseudomonadota bacterium]